MRDVHPPLFRDLDIDSGRVFLPAGIERTGTPPGPWKLEGDRAISGPTTITIIGDTHNETVKSYSLSFRGGLRRDCAPSHLHTIDEVGLLKAVMITISSALRRVSGVTTIC